MRRSFSIEMQCGIFVGSIFLFFFMSTVVQVARAETINDLTAGIASEAYGTALIPQEEIPCPVITGSTQLHYIECCPTGADQRIKLDYFYPPLPASPAPGW